MLGGLCLRMLGSIGKTVELLIHDLQIAEGEEAWYEKNVVQESSGDDSAEIFLRLFL
jgi:hypothetical protein